MTSLERSGDGTTAASDAELIAALKKGDLHAFDRLFERHHRSLISFFHHLSWDLHIAEECAQEVFLKLYAHAATYEPQAQFRTFLFTIAKNHWIDKLRSGAGRAKPVSLDADGPGQGGVRVQDRVKGHEGPPSERMERAEAEEALRKAIAALPEEHRLVVVLSELQGMKYQEIGAVLGIPVGTVKSRMFHAMERLKDLLTEKEG